MAVLPIVHFPDQVLEKECERVVRFDKDLANLLDKMYDTMIENDGVGLAAPQVGISRQIAIVDVGDDKGLIELINPEIIRSKGKEIDIEGCLSFPGLYGKVERACRVTVKAFDRHGHSFEIHAKGYLARAIQHEIDHLHGVLFTAKVIEYVDEHELELVEESD